MTHLLNILKFSGCSINVKTCFNVIPDQKGVNKIYCFSVCFTNFFQRSVTFSPCTLSLETLFSLHWGCWRGRRTDFIQKSDVVSLPLGLSRRQGNLTPLLTLKLLRFCWSYTSHLMISSFLRRLDICREELRSWLILLVYECVDGVRSMSWWPFLVHLVNDLPWSRVRVIGLTSMDHCRPRGPPLEPSNSTDNIPV